MSTLAIRTDRLTKQFAVPRPLKHVLRRPLRTRQTAEMVTAVNQVSLEVIPGELFGLLGPNGAGKTTLIKLLCTMVVPSNGEASLFGVDLRHTGQILQMIGMASGDERSFYWRLTGRQNLEFFASLYGLKGSAGSQRISQLLDQIGLAAQADRPFRTYSSGQKQRLSIARALLHHPRLLFLDEPTRSLDPTATMALHEFVEQELLEREGMTIFLTTHRLDEAQRLCHRIGIMDKGHLRTQGTPAELRAMLGPTLSYTLRVSGLAGQPVELAAGLPGRLDVTGVENSADWRLEMETCEGDGALGALIARIGEAGGRVVDVERRQPSLERVFQRFTQD